EWRNNKAKQLCPAAYNRFGADIFLHTSLVERIVDLAHVFKLSSIQDLCEQTAWFHSEVHGAEIIALVQRHCPKPQPASPFVSTPLTRRARACDSPTAHVDTSSVSARKAPAPPKCSACKTVGHRS
ncbi:hypothetical protein K474DRAFT_1571894, partial [Panus rudis PR-1116 ss-1]